MRKIFRTLQGVNDEVRTPPTCVCVLLLFHTTCVHMCISLNLYVRVCVRVLCCESYLYVSE